MSGADLEYRAMLARAGVSSGAGYDGALLQQMRDKKSSFNSRLSLFNYKSSNTRKIKAALAKAQAGLAQANICCIGDSETQGFIGGTQTDPNNYVNKNMWPAKMREALSSSYGIPAGGVGICPAAMAPAASYSIDNRYSVTGAWTYGSIYLSSSTNGATVTFVTDKPCTAVDVFYFNSSAAFSYTVDGGAVQTPPRDGQVTLAKHTVSGLANAVHTVVITVNAAAVVYIAGICGYSPSGVLVHNLGLFGSAASQWAAQANLYPSPLSSYNTRKKMMDLFAVPDLLIIQLGTNDLVTTGDIPSLVPDIISNLSLIRNFYPNSDCILSLPYEKVLPVQSQYGIFRDAMYELASTLDIPLVDMYERSGGYSVANANGFMGDTVHPNLSAQLDQGRLWAQILSV